MPPAANTAAAAGALRFEQTHPIAGVTPGIAQPSVMLIVHADASKLPADLVERLDALLRPLAGAMPRPSRETGGSPLGFVAACAHALQQSRGLPVHSPPIVQAMDSQRFRVLLPTVRGVHAVTARLAHALGALANAVAAGAGTEAPLAAVGAALRAVEREAPTGKNLRPMLATAARMGIPWERLSWSVYRLGQGAASRWFKSSITDRTPSIGVSLAKNKHEAADVLRRLSIPVPRHVLVRSEEEAVAAAELLGFPVVVKPADLARGVGVAARLLDADRVRRAWREAARHSSLVLVEEFFRGDDHRIHVFEGEVFRVRHRVAGGVVGDGSANVVALLERLNADPRRGPPGSSSELIRIDLDEEALEMLAEQGLDGASVPAAGRFVPLRRIANVAVGGVSNPMRIEDVHPDNLALAVRAVRALRLDLAAVDFLTPDIRRSWTEVGAAICEINAQPQFGADVPEWLYGRMFADQGRIPLVAVIGDANATRWMADLRAGLARDGVRVGFASAAGAWIGDARVVAAARGGAAEASMILVGDQDVDALLLDADASLMLNGFPSDRIDALVLCAGAGVEHYERIARSMAQCATAVLLDAAGEASWTGLRRALPAERQRVLAGAEVGRVVTQVLAASNRAPRRRA